MTRRKRRNHSSAFKAKVALSALKGERTKAGHAVTMLSTPALSWTIVWFTHHLRSVRRLP